jgi:GxxExxY protein
MPIKHKIDIKPISEDDFHQLDYKVMELGFAIHNEMGRFWDEKIYQNELARRCRESGFEKVLTEVPVSACFEDFEKSYLIDLLINNSIIYELKAVRSLNEDHLKQALHYLFLLDLQHGKLINFRPQSVEYRFVSTRLTPEKRFDIKIIDHDYQVLDDDSIWLKNFLINLLKEWGAFLDINLFYEAINYFRGGKQNVVQEIKVMYDSHVLGEQSVHLLNPKLAFKISAVANDIELYEQHLHRFIKYADLKAIQWINFNHKRIEFKTILK